LVSALYRAVLLLSLKISSGGHKVLRVRGTGRPRDLVAHLAGVTAVRRAEALAVEEAAAEAVAGAAHE
jgi:hypothetical protein